VSLLKVAPPECFKTITAKKESCMIKKRYIKIWLVRRKPFVGHLVKSFYESISLKETPTPIWNRFFHEATFIISDRFLCEATGGFF